MTEIHDIVIGGKYIFTAIKSALRKICIDNVHEGGIFDGVIVNITDITGGYNGSKKIWVKVVGSYPNPIPSTFANYYWPPECFAPADGYVPPKIVKRNVLNYWPGLKEEHDQNK